MLGETGFDMPESVQAATDEYRKRSDKIGRFVSEMLEPEPQGEILTTEAYGAYSEWCRRNGHYAESMTNFKAEIAAYAEIKKKTPGGERSGIKSASLCFRVQIAVCASVCCFLIVV